MAENRSRLIVRRFIICFLLTVAAVFAVSEIAFLFQQDRVARQPQTLTIVIPSGTAQRISEGRAVPTIPSEMAFLIGDTLIIQNNDLVDHQLGPIWVPPGSSGSLVLDEVDNFAYACSFQPSRYLGLNVRQPITLMTRLTALALATPPTTLVVFFYSLVAKPIPTIPSGSQSPSRRISEQEADSKSPGT